MDIKQYAEILKSVIRLQQSYGMEELEKTDKNKEYLKGVICGLQIALDKIDASMFLAEK